MARLSRNQLKTPVEIWRKTSAASPTGGLTRSTENLFITTFCELLPISSKDFVAAQASGVSIDAKIHLDYEIAVKTTDKIKMIDGTDLMYEVIGLMPVPQDNKKIVICKAVYK